MTTSQEIFRRQLRRLILVPLIVALLIAAVLELQVRRLTEAEGWVEHSDFVIAQARLLLRSIIDQETGLRGYLLSHDQRYLQPYHEGEASIPAVFQRLHDETADNSEQQQKVKEIRESYERWHTYAQDGIARMAGKDPAAGSAAFNLAGKAKMDEVRARQQEFVDEEGKLRDVRIQNSDRAGRTVSWTLLGLVCIFAVTLLHETRHNLHAVESDYAEALFDLQKRSAELIESRERLEVTLRSIGDAVIVTDTAGKITFANPVAEKLTQFTAKQADGKSLDEVFRIINEETRVTVESPFSKVMRMGQVVGLANHTLLVRPDGSEISIDDSGAPVRDEHGKIFGVVLVFRDVTEQKEILNALRSNEKLAAAGKLSASIAHEIHNPLETVRNLFYLLRKQADKEMAQLIEMAEQELTRVVQITKNMLSLYRESKKVMPVKLPEVVESVAALLQRQLRDKSIVFTTQFRTEAQISAFPAEMRQVASNLIANAIDAVEAGGEVAVSVEDAHLKNGNAAVALAVRDNGSGISPDTIEKLFRPFFTTKGEYGTGLGLWITQGIVSKHGGYIEVASDTTREKHGTTFRAVFPKLGG